MAARDGDVKLPDEWWEVFDCEREELGFLAAGMRSLETVVRREEERWEGQSTCMLTREDVREEMRRLGVGNGIGNGNGTAEDEEAEMARMLDAKAG
jgi:hypothetical protein